MKRKSLTFLYDWYYNKKAKPLILRGARQVGKSTLIKIFCDTYKIHLIELNF